MGSSPIRRFNPLAIEAKKNGVKVFHLNIGQPDVHTPDEFWSAVKTFQNPVLEYETSPGHGPLIEAMQQYYKKGYNIDYAPADIVITNGGSEALTIAFLALCDEGDEIVVPEPYYTNYATFAKASGAKLVPITTTAEEGYQFATREQIEGKITSKTKAIVFANPGNPTGLVLTAAQRRLIADIAKEKDIFVISDEVYREFIYSDEPASCFSQMEDVADRTIIIDSVSKRYSACGARIGAFITKNKELQAEVMKYLQGRLCCSTLDQVGAAALYSMDPSYYEEMKKEYKARRDIVFDKLQSIEGVVCKKPEGAFYIMAKLPIENTEDFLVYLLTEFRDNNETVMFAPAEGFYVTKGLGRSELRIACMLNVKDMERAMEIFERGLIEYKKSHK